MNVQRMKVQRLSRPEQSRTQRLVMVFVLAAGAIAWAAPRPAAALEFGQPRVLSAGGQKLKLAVPVKAAPGVTSPTSTTRRTTSLGC